MNNCTWILNYLFCSICKYIIIVCIYYARIPDWNVYSIRNTKEKMHQHSRIAQPVYKALPASTVKINICTTLQCFCPQFSTVNEDVHRNMVGDFNIILAIGITYVDTNSRNVLESSVTSHSNRRQDKAYKYYIKYFEWV